VVRLGWAGMGAEMRVGRTGATLLAVVALGLIAAACSKPSERGAGVQAGRNTSPTAAAPVGAGATNQSSSTTSGAAGATVPGAAGVGGGGNGATGGQSSTNPTTATGPANSDVAQQEAVGSKLYPQSTSRGSKPYYQGVGNNTIQLDFSYDATSCGVNVTNALTAAGGALPTTSRYYRATPTQQSDVVAQQKESIQDMVTYWNAHGFQSAQYESHIRPLMGNDPNNQYYGRHFTYNVIDGGSNQCPDKTKAAAIQAAEQDHAFAVFNNYDGAQYNMAADLNALPNSSRPMHFGTLWLSDSTYNKFAPYAWTQFATGTTIVRQLASYVCSELLGKKASNSAKSEANGGYQNTVRKFGLLHTNLPQDQPVINDFKSYLNTYCAKAGGAAGVIAKEVSYDGVDFSNAQRDDLNAIVQLHSARVTSVIMLGDPVQALFQVDDAKSQTYYPEWLWSSIGYGDSSTVQRLMDQTEAIGDIGTSNLGIPGGYGFGGGDPFAMYHSEHMVAPDGKACDPSSEAGMDHGGSSTGAIANYCKAPGALVTWYYTMLPFIGGVDFAGPDLTPQNVSAGLQHYPPTRYGGSGPTTDPRPALVGAGAGKYGFIVDAVAWKWRPDYTSPQPEAKAGWVTYPDCQRHYLLWPNDLAPNWQPTDPAYNAWCGAAGTGYPKTLSTDGE
jgi:hypothetical protein